MSWYDDEGKEAKRLEELKRRDEEIIRQATFWSDLRQQIESDMNGINNSAHWKEKLGAFPLRIQNAIDVNGYEVIKPGHPRVAVGVRHMGSHLMIDRKFTDKPVSGYKTTERLDFVVNQERVFLRTADKVLDVPEEMARYFLLPFIEILKEA